MRRGAWFAIARKCLFNPVQIPCEIGVVFQIARGVLAVDVEATLSSESVCLEGGGKALSKMSAD
jgi:hypothetical protein